MVSEPLRLIALAMVYEPPDCKVAPSANVSVPEPRAVALPTLIVPAFKLVPPLYVLETDKTNNPPPTFDSA